MPISRRKFIKRALLATTSIAVVDSFWFEKFFIETKEFYFERNRLLFSLNYKISKEAALQIGYLHQFDYKINDETGRDFLQVGLSFDLY